ncbi:hypothetical protein JK386_11205 [Nocardioides sp. zg-536]|uniref:Uncharacterized protein n=1 Tax=Nocardioides faecalis TaxID=2803858 RepID=A0A938Y261_9ACTN|nr:hypothetical protein [Nocardioides faecalis]MBM9460471.1 hypothetical protein [Nocardioides faecalis]MBS4752284.1 hypothetical protein [Nocardioides faecalis]QVI57590.1 hypothetical protein KG111_10865 [Nocardioides faecalis]
MSVTGTQAPGSSGTGAPPPRVRQQARDALVLMGFSLGVSLLCAALLLLARLGER